MEVDSFEIEELGFSEIFGIDLILQRYLEVRRQLRMLSAIVSENQKPQCQSLENRITLNMETIEAERFFNCRRRFLILQRFFSDELESLQSRI